MTDLHTNPKLLDKLRASASKELTADIIRQQRISYVMGTLKDDSSVTRDKVRDVLRLHEGKRSAA
jgi:hypothetical protein